MQKDEGRREMGNLFMNGAARYLRDPPSLKLWRTGRHRALQFGSAGDVMEGYDLETYGRMKCAVGRPAHNKPSLITGGTPAPLSAEAAHQVCHSAKRTHFSFSLFTVYQSNVQALVSFARAFANGFVLEKRTHLEGI